LTELIIIVVFVWAPMLAVMVYFFLAIARPWIRSAVSGIPISMTTILAMRLRGSPVAMLLDACIELRHRGSTASIADVEKQYLANRSRIRNARDLVDLVEQNAAATSPAPA
jgi:uncharacterized protein YqfA (UPF0365 family)